VLTFNILYKNITCLIVDINLSHGNVKYLRFSMVVKFIGQVTTA